MKIAHVINIFKCDPKHKSYLYHALPITVTSMEESKKHAFKKGIKVELYAAIFKEDEKYVPKSFNKLNFLKQSTNNLINTKKKLPLIKEIINNLYSESNADYLIYTNADIGLQKNFYEEVYRLINENKLESLIINRRDNIPKFYKGNRLTYQNLDLIYDMKGEIHLGWDCFIFHRNLFKKLYLDNLFIAYPPWGFILKLQLELISKKFFEFKNLFLTFHIGRDESWNDFNTNVVSNNLLKENLKNSQKIINLLVKYNILKVKNSNILYLLNKK